MAQRAAVTPHTRETVPLRDRIKAIAAQSAPSLVPDMKPAAPPRKEEEVIPHLDDVVKDRKQALEIARMIEQCGTLSAQSHQIEKQKKPLVEKLKYLIGNVHVGKIFSGAWRVNYYSAPRSTITEENLKYCLLARGFQPKDVAAIISESTSTSESYTLRITPAGEEE